MANSSVSWFLRGLSPRRGSACEVRNRGESHAGRGKKAFRRGLLGTVEILEKGRAARGKGKQRSGKRVPKNKFFLE